MGSTIKTYPCLKSLDTIRLTCGQRIETVYIHSSHDVVQSHAGNHIAHSDSPRVLMHRCPEVEDNTRLSQGSSSRPLSDYQGPSFSEGQCRAAGAGAVMPSLAACGLGRAVHLVASVPVRRGFCCYPHSSADICQRQADVNREGKTVGNTDIHQRVTDTSERIK